MWNKVKNFFSITGAVLSIVLFTVILFLLCGGNSYRRRNRDTDERDTRIKEGFDSASGTAAKCEERLHRAEEILRNAAERSRKEREKSENNSNDN